MAQHTQVITIQTGSQQFATYEEYLLYIQSHPEGVAMKQITDQLRNVQFVVADYFVNGNEVTVVRVWNEESDYLAYKTNNSAVIDSFGALFASWGWSILSS
jgi:hypothetical protein